MIVKTRPLRGTSGQCHASTVCRAGSRFMVAWFEGAHEGAANCEIRVTVGDQHHWSAPTVVSGGLAPCWNPVLHRQRSGRLLLYFKVGATISSWRTYLAASDDGDTWSGPRPLVDDGEGGRGPVRTSPVRLDSGRLLAGASTERWDGEPRWDAFVEISDDDGLTWRRTDDIAVNHNTFRGAGIIQPTIWSNPDGSVRLLARSTSGELIGSTSRDAGETWSPGRPSGVPTNNSAVSACAYGDEVFLAHNPVAGDWAARTPLVLSRSRDGGETWSTWVTLDDDPGVADADYRPADSGVRTSGRAEFSYPSTIAVPGGLAVTYTWQRRAVVLALIDPSAPYGARPTTPKEPTNDCLSPRRAAQCGGHTLRPGR